MKTKQQELSVVAILGNGPSLASIDLKAFDSQPTIGMNAAYRYWDRIGWYPSYYCCLDEVVVMSHATAIAELLNQGRIKAAFLSGAFFRECPEFIGDPRVLDLDVVSDFWFEHRGRAEGKTRIRQPAFDSCNGYLTTGSWAVRWAAHLGYSSAHLYGFDLSYVNVIPEAAPVDGIRLKVTETPKQNPNYFFDDYQQVGDEYQIANPEGFDRALHVLAMESLLHDFSVQGVRLSVRNAQVESGLGALSIFPTVRGRP